MLTREIVLLQESWQWASVERKCIVPRPGGLYLVTPHELRELEEALSRGRMPMDFERKLCRLGGGSLLERYLEQNCRLICSLLLAHRQGLFDGVASADYDRLLRVLAYVRKDEDVIPDYRSDGFKDDAQEVRALETELAPVLKRFKQWRLRHQVPGLWLRRDAQVSRPRAAAFCT